MIEIGAMVMFGNVVTRKTGVHILINERCLAECPFCKKEVRPVDQNTYFFLCNNGVHFQFDKDKNPQNCTEINGEFYINSETF